MIDTGAVVLMFRPPFDIIHRMTQEAHCCSADITKELPVPEAACPVLLRLKRKEYLEGFHSGRLLSIRGIAQHTHFSQSVVLDPLDRFGIMVEYRSTFCA